MKTATLLPELPTRHKNDACCATLAPPSMTVQRAEVLAEQLKAVADPTRLRLLDLLAQQQEPICVCDITPQFAQNQPTISHHLKLLRAAGLIDTDKRGIWSYFWATENGVRMLKRVTS